VATIEELEGVRWRDPGPPGPESTYLVRRCHELRRTPLESFTVEDLRIMLGQRIAVPILLPMALAVLREDPLAEGNYYPGDLLLAVLRLPDEMWHGNEADRALLVAASERIPPWIER